MSMNAGSSAGELAKPKTQLRKSSKALLSLQPPAEEDLPNFRVGDREFRYAPHSLYLLSASNPLRIFAVRVLHNPWFDRFILFVIAVNSVVLATTDYKSIILDVPESDPNYGALDTRKSYSVSNYVQEQLDPIFTAIFLVEFFVKVLALGFIRHKRSYLRDSWNLLDFVIVVTSSLGLLENAGLLTLPNVSAIRVFRVLRPLKSLTSLPGLAVIVSSLLNAIPALTSVIILIMFIFAIFGILSMQVFKGITHQRCRLTPFPVTLSYRHERDYESVDSFRCLPDAPNWSTIEDGKVLKETSPWYRAKDCYWPFVETDERLCSMPDSSGAHTCVHGHDEIPRVMWSWCGSNYDVFGNARFSGNFNVSLPDGTPVTLLESEEILKDLKEKYNSMSPTDDQKRVRFFDREEFLALPAHHQNVNYGLIKFDNFLYAFVAIFQAITKEGWTVILYYTEDASGYVLAEIFFGVLIVFGSFFVLNLLLAVLEENYGRGKNKQKADDEVEAIKEQVRRASIKDGSFVDTRTETQKRISRVVNWTGIPTLRAVADNTIFQNILTAAIVINTVILASGSYPANVQADYALEVVNFFLTLIFVVELIVKSLGTGPKEYCSDGMNNFDAVIVLFSLVELCVDPPEFISGDNKKGSAGISALRSFRIFRIFKLARKWTSMRVLLAKIIVTAGEISNFSVLLFLFMYIYALIGMQFFSNKFKFDNDQYPIPVGYSHPSTGIPWKEISSSRTNFDTFHDGFVSIFQILSGENWPSVMYEAWLSTSFLATIYFVSLVIFGQFILITLFLAILLNNFSVEEEDGDDEDDSQDAEKVSSGELPEASGESSKIIGSSKIVPVAGNEPITATTAALPSTPTNAASASGLTEENSIEKDIEEIFALEPRVNLAAMKKNKFKKQEKESVWPLTGRAVFCLGPENKFRIMCAKVCSHPSFDPVILVVIVISSLMLAVDNPLNDPNGQQAKIMGAVDIVFTIIFVLEMSSKIFAMGFLFQKRAYLRDPWNVLDFVVVIISILTMFSDGNANLTSLRSLRAFRAFRPLRMINRAPGLRLIVNCLFASIPDVLNVAAVCAIFFLIFSIIGVNLYKGQIRMCQGAHFDNVIIGTDAYEYLVYPFAWDSSNDALTAIFSSSSQYFPADATVDCGAGPFPSQPCCVESYHANSFSESKLQSYGIVPPRLWASTAPTSRDVCECLGGTWDIIHCDDEETGCFPWLFDNIGQSFMTFFELSSTEGWIDSMNAGQDTRGIGMQPVRDANKFHSIFYMCFILVGSYLVMNLFVGVIIDNFNQMRKNAEGDVAYLTEEQQAWVKTQQIATRMKPKKKIFLPGNWFGNFCHSVVLDRKFDNFIMLCIVSNTVVMMLPNSDDATDRINALKNLNLAFALIFTAEMIMKLAAMKKLYFDESWNRFDCVIVLGTLIGLFLQAFMDAGPTTSKITTVVRTFRIGRVCRLVNGAESLNQLFNTLVLTIPGVVNVGGLLMLLYFIFSIMGVQLFSTVGFHNGYDEYANFRNFGTTFILLLRFSTGENWNGFMVDVAKGPKECNKDPVYDPKVCGYASVTDDVKCNFMFIGNEDIQTDVNGCGNPVIYLYMYVFQLVICFVFLNLFIGIILEGFDTADETKRSIQPEDFEKFSEHWADFDPLATYYLSLDDLKEFVRTLYAPWGFAGAADITDNEVRAKIAELDLKISKDGFVHFKDTLMALSREAVKTEFIIMKMHENKLHAFDVLHRAKAPLLHKIGRVTALPGADFRVGHHYAAEIITDFFKKYVKGKGGIVRERKAELAAAKHTKRGVRKTLKPKAVEHEAEDEHKRASSGESHERKRRQDIVVPSSRQHDSDEELRDPSET